VGPFGPGAGPIVVTGDDDPIGLTPAQADALLESVGRYLRQHEAELRAGVASYVYESGDAAAHERGRQIAAALREDEPPPEGAPADGLLRELFETAVRCGTIHPHPGFMAHIPSGGLFESAVGDFLARALNRFPGVWLAAPGLIQLEVNVIRWFCRMLGYGPDAFGYLTTSGSLAHWMAVTCACRGQPRHLVRLYASEQAHFSVGKAARLAGFAPENVHVVPTRPDLGLDLDALEAGLRRDRGPACVVATAGTTNTGAIDDLRGAAVLCERYGAWLHVDACFGGFFRLTSRGRAALAGIERADSIAVDPHKSLFLPHGSSALLVRDQAALRATFAVPDAAYLPGAATEPALVDLCNYGPELTRELRGLAVWLPLKLHGLRAFEQGLDRAIDLAAQLAAGLEGIPGVTVVRRHPQLLPVVAFGAAGRDAGQLCEAVCRRGRVYITTTSLPGVGRVARACILNHRTGRADVEALIAEVRSLVG
jgi:glutamate/tyrosine decarboxylase-like PLP-dependent enzyme